MLGGRPFLHATEMPAYLGPVSSRKKWLSVDLWFMFLVFGVKVQRHVTFKYPHPSCLRRNSGHRARVLVLDFVSCCPGCIYSGANDQTKQQRRNEQRLGPELGAGAGLQDAHLLPWALCSEPPRRAGAPCFTRVHRPGTCSRSCLLGALSPLLQVLHSDLSPGSGQSHPRGKVGLGCPGDGYLTPQQRHQVPPPPGFPNRKD